MRVWLLALLVTIASCVKPVSFTPYVDESTPIDSIYVQQYHAHFEVACDSCRVEYGRDNETFVDVVDGGWSRSQYLGSLQSGQSLRVVLYVQPIGERRILGAWIRVNNEIVASAEEQDRGESITLSARVRQN